MVQKVEARLIQVKTLHQPEPDLVSARLRPAFVAIDESQGWTAAHVKEIRQRVYEECSESRAVNLDLSRVQHVSGGLFGMLCDLNDEGFKVLLYDPQPEVCSLIWFQRFFEHDHRNAYRFRSDPQYMQEE